MGRQVRTSISLLVAAVATVSTPAARGFSRWSRKPPALDRHLTFARGRLQQFVLKIVRLAMAAACLWLCCGSQIVLGQLVFNGTVNVPFNFQLTFVDNVDNQPCPLPMTTTLNSAPPPAPGLTLSSTGLLSGTPTTAGTFPFTFTFVYQGGGSRCVVPTTVTDSFNIAPAPPSGCTLTANPSQLPAGGGLVTLTTSCSGGSPATSYAWTGPNVTPSTSTPSQQVNVTATSTFSVTASNAAGPSNTPQVTVLVGNPPSGCTLTANPSQLPAGGGLVTLTTSCSGGGAPTSYAWTGPNVTPSSSTPSQQVNVTATSTFSVTASNAAGSAPPASAAVTVAPPQPPSGCTLTANPPQAPAGGGPVTLTTSCSGGGAPTSYTWTGPNVNPSTSTPSQQVNVTTTSTFSVTASNAAGSSPPATVTVTVASITLSPTTLLAGTVGVPYSRTITASGGTAPYTFTVSSGALPAALTLNPQTGSISGTPTSPGTSSFTITVRDVSVGLGSQAYVLTVSQASLATIQLLSGGNQTGVLGKPLPQDIVLALKDANGNPVPRGALVDLTVLPDAGVSVSTEPIANATRDGRAVCFVRESVSEWNCGELQNSLRQRKLQVVF